MTRAVLAFLAVLLLIGQMAAAIDHLVTNYGQPQEISQ